MMIQELVSTDARVLIYYHCQHGSLLSLMFQRQHTDKCKKKKNIVTWPKS